MFLFVVTIGGELFYVNSRKSVADAGDFPSVNTIRMNSWKLCYSRLLIPRTFTRALSLLQIAVWFSLKRHMVRGRRNCTSAITALYKSFSPWCFVYPNTLSLLLCYSIAFIWPCQSFARQFSIAWLFHWHACTAACGLLLLYFMHIVNHIIINSALPSITSLFSCHWCLPQHCYGGARHHPGFGVQSCRSAIHHCAELSVDLSWGLLWCRSSWSWVGSQGPTGQHLGGECAQAWRWW